MNFRQNLKIPVIVHVAPMRRFKKEFTTVKPVWKKKIGNTSYITPPNSEIICGRNVSTKVVCGMILFFEKKAILKD